MIRRRTLLATLPLPALGQGFPTRPLRILTAFAAGGGTDLIARTLAQALIGPLGQQVIVENRPGAGGNLATEICATAPADGYTLLMGNHGPMSVNPTLFRNLRVNPETALEPIGLVADAPLVVVVGSRSQARDFPGLMAEIRAARGDVNYGSASNGSASHLAAALLLQMAGAEAEHIPYRGAAPALTDIVGGVLHFMITTLPSAVGLISGGQLRALAVTGERSIDVLPGVPPVAATVPGYKATAWYGILVRAGTPQPVVARLAEAQRTALADPTLITRLRDEGCEPSGMDGPAFGRLIREERVRWAEVVRQARITVD
ncbi:MAG: tripartite tricarboxylate transporter substrate binding protein [Rubritepida sp.]|nr:tripartite tricarboxylate transporter substrate binding protein [Rubritepida sp.]